MKQNTGDRTWAFKFPYYENGTLSCKVAYVCTFKAKDAKYNMKRENPDKMVLSVRHASLLAMLTICRITDICCQLPVPTIMPTPLCGAIFSKLDIGRTGEVAKLQLSVWWALLALL